MYVRASTLHYATSATMSKLTHAVSLRAYSCSYKRVYKLTGVSKRRIKKYNATPVDAADMYTQVSRRLLDRTIAGTTTGRWTANHFTNLMDI
jgi:hypothetical protein